MLQNPPPDLRIGGLTVNVLRYQYPVETDYWDGNWVIVQAHCDDYVGRVAELTDPCWHTPELVQWLEECKQMQAGERADAGNRPMEPYLEVAFVRAADGGVQATVNIFSYGTGGTETFEFGLKASFLTGFIESLEALVTRYPVRGRLP